jgi:hypothetical protein
MAQNGTEFNPRFRELHPSKWDVTVYTLNYVFEYNDHIFDILLSPRAISGYDAAHSIESQYLQRMEDASFCDGEDEEEIERMFEESDRLEHEIRIKVLEVSQAIMQNETLGDETQRNLKEPHSRGTSD